MFVTVPVVRLPQETVSVGIAESDSCDWNTTVMVSPTFAYPEFVLLLELNEVDPVMRYGDSLSILICTEVLVSSVLFNLSVE
jgi:hypothetical protein